LFLDLWGIRHVLDNRFPIALPLSLSLSIPREVVSYIRFVLSCVVSWSLSVLSHVTSDAISDQSNEIEFSPFSVLASNLGTRFFLRG
jgi:hypothetical protein